MTVPQFSRPGAIDLSALRRPAGTASATGSGGSSAAATGGGYTIDITSEQSLRSDVVERSMSAVVLVSFWSPQVPASVEINTVLSKLADEYAGRFLFARLDIEGQPDLAQALGIPQVPLVVAALRGQLAPLIQEALPEPEMRALVDQILQSAVANGVAGTVESASPSSAAPAADEPADEPVSRFPAAEAALLSGDLDAAVKGYEEGLLSSPGDPEASLGLSQAKLLKRTQGVDQTAAREAAASRPDDVGAQQLAADLDLMGGNVEDAFGRLIDLVRRTSGDERDRAREHLIEMFGVVGDADPRVAKARQQLASALF